MNLLEAVKEAVTTRDAAECYGIEIDRSGKACCIFYNDRHPSMKVDERFHCFSCGVDGDVIDFISQLFDVGLKEAAERLAADFCISYDLGHTESRPPKHSPTKARWSLLQRLKNYQNENYRALCVYFGLLRQWQAEYAETVTVDTSLPKEGRMRDFLRQVKNPYLYRHGKYVVKLTFSETDVTLEELMAEYIRSKCAAL